MGVITIQINGQSVMYLFTNSEIVENKSFTFTASAFMRTTAAKLTNPVIFFSM